MYVGWLGAIHKHARSSYTSHYRTKKTHRGDAKGRGRESLPASLDAAMGPGFRWRNRDLFIVRGGAVVVRCEMVACGLVKTSDMTFASSLAFIKQARKVVAFLVLLACAFFLLFFVRSHDNGYASGTQFSAWIKIHTPRIDMPSFLFLPPFPGAFLFPFLFHSCNE